ncbi:hypothetical protein [Neobacillus sp. LXY-1]|uniref:hypothetical protein n=1 Tax=Neobacillus sp. LXY-1 TaxID=3379133 RepID=UPI003EDFAA04
MKKLVLLIMTALLLTACTPKAYTESLDAGKAALQKGDYDKAINQFENALEEKETQEAQDYLHFSKIMQDSITLYHSGEFEKASQTIKTLLTEKFSKNVNQKIVNQANVWAQKIEDAKTLSDVMKQNIEKGNTLLEQKQYDQAYDLFKQVADTKNVPEVASIEEMVRNAAKLAAETNQKKNDRTSEDSPNQSNEQTSNDSNKKDETKQGSANQSLTQDQAADLVKQSLNISNSSNEKVQYDHEENGAYIFRVYEFVVDNPGTGEGHTATRGWYGVNKETKKVYNAME